MKQTAAAVLALLAVARAVAAAPASPHRGSGDGSASAVLAPLPRRQLRQTLLAVGVQHTSAAHAPAKSVPMQTVEHSKEAGDGYTMGSPLYGKRQEQGTTGNATAVAPAAVAPADTAVAADAPASEQRCKHLWDCWKMYPRTMVTIMVFYVLFMVIVAYAYRALRAKGILGKPSIEELRLPFQGDAFTYGFFDVSDCKQDWPIWLSAFCCPTVRWADTVSSPQVSLLGFWVALFVVLGLHVLGPLTVFGTSGIVALLGVYYRQRLRLLFGHEPKQLKTIALDCLAWVCCPVCAIVQEAREVEKVHMKHAGQAH